MWTMTYQTRNDNEKNDDYALPSPMLSCKGNFKKGQPKRIELVSSSSLELWTPQLPIWKVLF